MTSTNVREHNNADDDPVTRDIEYDIDAKAMKLSEVTDMRSDNLPEINIRRENRAMVSSAEEDDDHNSAEIQKNKWDENSETATVSGNHESNKEPNDEVIPYLHYHTFPNAYSFLDLGEIPDLLNIETIPVSVKKLKFKVHRGQVQKDLIDAFTGLAITNAIISFKMAMPNGNQM